MCLGKLKQPKLDVGTVQNRLWEARVKWYNIGIELSLKEDDLEAIKSDNRDIDSCFRCMISMWLRQVDREPTVAWTKIIEALKAPSVNFSQLAHRLVEFVENTTTVHKVSGKADYCKSSNYSANKLITKYNVRLESEFICTLMEKSAY